MSELRWNALLGEWTVTATHRQERTFFPPADYCPLCPTIAGGFPTEVSEPSYRIAVLENKFPSLRRDPPPPEVTGDDLAPVAPAYGACEVVLYTSRHDATLTDLSLEAIDELIRVWQHRTSVLEAMPGIAYVLAFENKGAEIGVTLAHPHGQIYAYPFVPPRVAAELAAARTHRARTGGCLLCDVRARETRERARIVREDDAWTAFVPFAARWPYETHLVARRHVASIADLDRLERRGLARLLKDVLVAFDRLFERPFPYIMAIHGAPVDPAQRDDGHLHIEFYPPLRTATKLKFLAGSETGGGMFINDTLPEEKAAELRSHLR